jgi:hypothetical protein
MLFNQLSTPVRIRATAVFDQGNERSAGFADANAPEFVVVFAAMP